MKILSIVFAILFGSNDAVSISTIRDAYKVCNESRENADAFYELTKKALQKEDPIYKGYHGAALALKAAFSWNPISKLSYFNKGKKLIDESIELDPNNIELRMIRLSIQSNTPKIVGYYKNIEEDRDFIRDNIDNVTSEEQKEYIQGFIEYSEVFAKP